MDDTRDPLREMLAQMSKQNDAIIRMLEQKSEVVDALNALAQAQGMDIAVQNGLSMISEQLAPLRNLAPPRTLLHGDAPARLANLRASLDREEWGGVQGLKVDSYAVNYIGATAPPSTPPPSSMDVLFYVRDPGYRGQRGEAQS